MGGDNDLETSFSPSLCGCRSHNYFLCVVHPFSFFFRFLLYTAIVCIYIVFLGALYIDGAALLYRHATRLFLCFTQSFPLITRYFFLLLFVDASSVRNPFSSSCVQTSSLPVFKARGPSLHFNNLLCFLFPSFSLGRERSFHYHDDQLVL